MKTETSITPTTLIPIGVAATVIASFVGGAIWISGSISDLSHRIDLLEASMKGRLETISESANRSMSRIEFRAYARELAARNPTMNVPLPE